MTGRKKKRRWALLFLMIGLVGGLIAFSQSRIGIMLTKSKAQFKTLEVDDRIFYAPGTEERAQDLARGLGAAVATIERNQLAIFPKPIMIYICASQKNWNEYCGTPRGSRVRGAMVRGKVFISPDRPDWDLVALVAHELSHLHLAQWMGNLSAMRTLPEWFQEGLAVVVSGAGGELVSPEDAETAILSGKTLTRRTRGHLPYRFDDNQRLGGYMFYRQSALFTKWLRDGNRAGFDNLLRDLQAGRTFEPCFIQHLGKGVEEAWQAFVADLKEDQSKPKL